ncbi:MAG: T9SS type A sorting domain-containing protein [Bacteroidales bacterium]|nr:T9SS type A sorting domain-containing protein [Bacteroidales bacterium]MCF8397069.1 T9SS type A sorting domain-containing protein [Bacteroidales bacterium]
MKNQNKNTDQIKRKNQLLSSLLVALCLLFANNTLLSQTNIDIPGTDAGGNPIGELLYIESEDKIIAYSPKNLLIYQASDHTLLDKIPISNVSKFNPGYFNPEIHICDIQLMTYNETENDVYFVHPELKIYSLDLDSPDYLVQEILPTPADISHFKYLHGPTNLKFDNFYNRLYWVINGRDENENCPGRFHVMDSYLAIYDVSYTGGDPSLTEFYDLFNVNNTGNYENSFHNVVFCEDNDYFFMAKKGWIDRYEIMPDNSVVIEKMLCTRAYKLGKMLYIHEDGFHKLLVFPYRLPDNFNEPQPEFEVQVDFYVIDCDNPVPQIDCGNPIPESVDEILAPSKRVTDAIYLADQEKLVVCYSPDVYIQPQPDNTDVAVYNKNNGQFVLQGKYATNEFTQFTNTTMLNHPMKLTAYNNNSVLISKQHELTRFYPSNGTYTSVRGGISNYFKGGVSFDNLPNNIAYIINAATGYLKLYDGTDVFDSINTNSQVYHIEPLRGTTKFVVYNKLNSHQTSFFIHDYENSTTLESEAIDGSIGDIIYNKYNNKILVAVNSYPGMVAIYNHAGVKEGEIPLPPSDVNHNYMRKMYINPDGLLFLTSNMKKPESDSQPRLLICNASDYSNMNDKAFEMPAFGYNFYFYNAYFCYNEINGNTYFTVTPDSRRMGGSGTVSETGPPDPYISVKNALNYFLYPVNENDNGKLFEFDPKQDLLQEVCTFKFPREVIFQSNDNSGSAGNEGTLFVNAEEVYSVDCETNAKSSLDVSMYKIIYDTMFNKLYGLDDASDECMSDRIVRIHEIDKDGTTTILEEIDGQAGGFFINPHNGFLNVYMRFDDKKLGDLPARLIEIDPLGMESNVTHDLDITFAGPDLNLDVDAGQFYYSFTTPFIDSVNNKIYLPNGGHSNISVVEFERRDFLSLREGITWLSFPRMDQIANNPPDVLLGGDNIIPTDYILGSYLITMYQGDDFESIFNGTTWPQTEILDINSPEGYKLELYEAAERDLILQGTLPELGQPEADVYLYNDYENWVGYYLEETQNIFDAIPEDILDDISSIKHQDWFVYNENLPDPPPPDGTCRAGWKCGNNVEHNISYGEMVIIKTFYNDHVFQWIPSGNTTSGGELLETEYYAYNELSDYTAVYIEPDTSENPLEIGAFVNDTCIGAATVGQSDTLIELRAYTDTSNTGNILFEEYYGLKSGPKRIEEYYVENPQNGRMYKRKINTTEKQLYFSVSFRDKRSEKQVPERCQLELSCIPNPVKDKCKIHYRVPLKSDVKLKVFDLYGKLINVIYDGMTEAGEYAQQWNISDNKGNVLLNGVYIIELRVNDHKTQSKIVVAK